MSLDGRLQRAAAPALKMASMPIGALAACFWTLPLNAQSASWQSISNSTGSYLYTTVNVGIGNTGMPGVPLTLYQNTQGGKLLLLDTLAQSEQAYVWFGDVSMPKYAIGKHVDNSFTLWDQTQGRNVFHVLSSGDLSLRPAGGNVGIGTESPQYPLSVNGTIQAKEVVVNTRWADFVFAPDYRLQPLSTVSTYIRRHQPRSRRAVRSNVTEHGVSAKAPPLCNYRAEHIV